MKFVNIRFKLVYKYINTDSSEVSFCDHQNERASRCCLCKRIGILRISQTFYYYLKHSFYLKNFLFV